MSSKETEHIAAVLYSFEMDWPEQSPIEIAAAALNCPDALGPHSGDCTGEIHTCLRCERERMVKQAEIVIRAVDEYRSKHGS